MPNNNRGMGIGKVIRQLRKARSATLEDIAFAAGTNASNLSRIERGRQGYSPETLDAIASALGVSVADLYHGAEADKVDARSSRAGIPAYDALSPENQALVNDFVKLLLRRQKVRKARRIPPG